MVCVAEKLLAPKVAAVPAIFEGAIAAELLMSALTIVPSTISDDEIHAVEQFTSEAVPAGKFVSADPSPANAVAFTLPFTSSFAVGVVVPTPTFPLDSNTAESVNVPALSCHFANMFVVPVPERADVSDFVSFDPLFLSASA
jgi:hypothetical protein